jgi:hypothetical protein
MARSLLSMTPWAAARQKDRVFFSQHNHLNDEIAALDDAPELAPEKKIILFLGTFT